MSENADLVLVIGSQKSSNSQRLVEVALRAGAKSAYLIDDASHIDWAWFNGVEQMGITAGASAPENLITEVLETLKSRYAVDIHEESGREETVTFKLPRVLTEQA